MPSLTPRRAWRFRRDPSCMSKGNKVSTSSFRGILVNQNLERKVQSQAVSKVFCGLTRCSDDTPTEYAASSEALMEQS